MIRRARGSLLAVVLVALACASSPGCSCGKRVDDGTAPVDEKLPPATLRDDTPNVLLTWIDDRGDVHSATGVSEIPIGGRAMVRVVFADKTEGTGTTFYVADMTRKRDDGTYPVESMSRRKWEAEIERRREEYLAKISPTPQPRRDPGDDPKGDPKQAPDAPKGAVTVIIYGASWCKPCHQAADYLRSRGVPYVLKDIEESPEAAREMREKLSRVGEPSGSIPVIDVKGQILIGFSRGALDQALAKAGRSGDPGKGNGTVL